jgi:two-component system OmpR family sensor kinase
VPRSSSLFRRQLLVQLALFALVWLALAGIVLGGIFASGAGLLDRDARTTSEALARFASVSPTTEHARAVVGHMSAIVAATSFPAPATGDVALRVWRADGVLLARGTDALPDLEPLAPGATPPSADGWRFGTAASPDGAVHAAIGFSPAYLERLRAQSLRNLVLPFAVLSLLLVAIAWVAARVGLAPLQRLARQIAQREVADLSPVLPAELHAEVEPLVAALNAQLRGTAERLERERRFFADAAHELRTPLAVLGAQAHVVANESDSERRRESLAALESGVDRAARVVQRLLTLARLDAARASDPFEPLDLGDLVEAAMAALAPRAEQGGHRLVAEDVAPLLVTGSEEALRAALENLVDNALRYTPAGTTIVVSVRRDADAAVLEVADDGPGIDPGFRARVFERFERLGRRGDDGTGLGLAIVRRVAELHGGSATYAPGDDGRGCRFALRIPLAADGHPA